jgi:hypothetical protein
MLRSERSLHLLLSSPPDAIPYGITTARMELDRVREMPSWGLDVEKPTLLFRLSGGEVLPETLTLVQAYRAALGDALRFGAWAEIPHDLHVKDFAVIGHGLAQLSREAGQSASTLLLTTKRNEPFSGIDATMPVGLGTLLAACPPNTSTYLQCPDTSRYATMASLLQVSVLNGATITFVSGEDALSPRPAPSAQVVFLSPWRSY